MLDGLACNTAGSDSLLRYQQPSMQLCQRWLGVLPPQLQALRPRQADGLLFNRVQRRDAPQRFDGDQAAVGSLRVQASITHSSAMLRRIR